MARYREIVGGSWEHKSVFAESVPHLLHQDMSYLWALEQQPDQRPKTWATRVEAWKVLLRLFFLDQLIISPEELRQPLLDVTERFGVRRVTWLRNKATSQAMGVLSPTVIVRPLPDFVDEDLDRWRAQLKDNDRDFRHLLAVAVRSLEQAAAVSPFSTRIAEVLRRELSPAATSQRAPGGREVEVPLLQRLTWERTDGDLQPVVSVNLSVRSDLAGEIAQYVPYCAACGALLLQGRNAPAIEVGTAEVKIRCANPQCTSPDQEVPLTLFGIWLRDGNTAVVWTPEQIPPMPELMLPPPPTVAGSELEYEWNAASIGGESFRRFLRLRFRDRRIDVVQLMSIFFTRLLVPGQFSSFSGSAVRPEWSDALDATQPAEVRALDEQTQVEFRNVAIHGWPLQFSRFYKALSLQRAPELAVGLFPDPSVVGPGWKWFRAFIDGAGSEQYRVACSDGMQVLGSFSSTEHGVPRSISVRSAADPAIGVSYIPQRLQRDDEYGGTVTASMAFDFGTTNTVVYWQPPQRQQQRRLVPRAETHGLNPRDLARQALWLADNRAWREAESIASFLPGPLYRRNATDPYIVPSEVWRVGREGFHLVRWSTEDPDGKNRAPLGHFKWDSDDVSVEGYTPTRLAYLRELTLQALPVVLAAFDPARVTAVKLGFAFPLAFEHEARVQFRRMLDALAAEVARLTGLEVTAGSSINESKACVNAFGSFNGETFLVADMGGGTLDVALFSYDPDGTMRPHQMGSLRYAGERCVEALAAHLNIPEASLRDSIAVGDSAKKHGKHTAERVVTQFTTIAFEFLRVMVAAFRKEPDRAEETINIVLIGNGWHLVEAFSSEVRVRGGKGVYREVYKDMVSALGDPQLVFYDRPPLTEFPSSKHLVVAGALQNVTAQSTTDELSESEIKLACLPAGRTIEFASGEVPWWSLVGEGIDLPEGLDVTSAAKARLHVRLDEMPPIPNTAWQQRLANSVGAKNGVFPYPTEGELQRELRSGLSGTPAKMKRGPLQVILELEWAQALSRRPGSVQ